MATWLFYLLAIKLCYWRKYTLLLGGKWKIAVSLHHFLGPILSNSTPPPEWRCSECQYYNLTPGVDPSMLSERSWSRLIKLSVMLYTTLVMRRFTFQLFWKSIDETHYLWFKGLGPTHHWILHFQTCCLMMSPLYLIWMGLIIDVDGWVWINGRLLLVETRSGVTEWIYKFFSFRSVGFLKELAVPFPCVRVCGHPVSHPEIRSTHQNPYDHHSDVHHAPRAWQVLKEYYHEKYFQSEFQSHTSVILLILVHKIDTFSFAF